MALQRGQGDSPHQPSDDPDLGEFGRLLSRWIRLLVRGPTPGVVVAVTPEGAQMPLTVDVQPSLMSIFYGDDGAELPLPQPIRRACPVLTPNLGGFAMRVRPRVGDFGLLLPNERSLEGWYKAAGVPIPPPFDHLHSASDSFFLPAGRPAPAPLQHSTDLAIGTDTGAAPGAELGEIVITPAGQVTVRSNTVVALEAPAVQLTSGDPLGAFLTVLHAAVTAWTPVPNDGGAALKTALAAWLAMQPPGP